MDRSLFWFIVGFSLLLTSWVFYLCLSTCLGEPLRQLISHVWERLLDYADRQPKGGAARWSRREGNSFVSPYSYTRLGDRRATVEGHDESYYENGKRGSKYSYEQYEMMSGRTYTPGPQRKHPGSFSATP